MKHGEVKSFSRINPKSSSLHRKNGRFVGLTKHDLMTAVQYPPSVMIYGLCPIMTQLIFFFTIRNSNEQHQVPQNLRRQARNLNGFSWMQYVHARQSRCHRSKLVSNFLKKKNIKTLDWPSNSPNLNPIEKQWAA